MKKILVFFITAFILLLDSEHCLPQQSITVKAGTRTIDHFPPSVRFRYPEFIQGKAFFRNSTFTSSRFNYNFLTGNMEFIRSGDTLEIIEPEKIKFIVIDQDTFYFSKVYFEVLYSNDFGKLAVNRCFKLVARKKQAAYGTTSSTSAISSYNSLSDVSGYYKLEVNDDLVFRMEETYYLHTVKNGFVPFWRKKILQLFPEHEDKIKAYYKQYKVDFKNKSDLTGVLQFLNRL